MIRHSRKGLLVVGAMLIAGAVGIACGADRDTFDVGDARTDGGTPGFGNQDASDATTPSQEAGPGKFNDAEAPDGSGCTPDAGGPGPVKRHCLPATDNECDGTHDLPTFPSNGLGGNGFDDDCDGLVDEGCSCQGAGTTKECYLVPASQTYGGVPVGWCAVNAKGTVDCKGASSEVNTGGTWSGVCRGAQLPFQDDFCAKGDFNCDGADQNSLTQDCTCKGDPIQCPTDALETAPFPPPAALPLKVDATSWFVNPADVASASNWKWTLVGGDCDNIIPHPTFAVYSTPNGLGTRVGNQVDTLGLSGKEHGYVAVQPSVTNAVYPAFSLSGDYLVQGEFDLNGRHFSCQQQVKVRAPGIRAEACWDTVGSIDLDLHVGVISPWSSPTCSQNGWDDTCAKQDCYFSNCAGDESTDWFPGTPGTTACQGWGSRRTGACSNPRLDRDILASSCTPSITDPNDEDFCGTENTNIDNPPDGSKFAVALKYWTTGTRETLPHVNVYCNGERVLSAGYNPVTGVGFPKMTTGGSSDGDLWKVAMVTAHNTGGVLTCDVAPVSSATPHAATDGASAYCVDATARNTSQSVKLYTPGGSLPLDADAMCFH